MSGLGLNLANVDLEKSDFDAIPSGTYTCHIVKVELKGTKGGDNAVLPKDTPMFNVHLQVDGGEYDKRMVFRQLILAPAKIDGQPYEHKAMMDRQLGQFLVFAGFSEDEVKAKGFEPDFEQIIGNQIRVVVGQKEYQGSMQNVVKGFKRVGDDGDSGGSLL